MTALVQTRIDSSVKAGAERVLRSMGMSLNDGIRIFLTQVKMEKALPFKPFVVDEPNKDTMNAVNRVNKREGLKKISLKEFDNMLDK